MDATNDTPARSRLEQAIESERRQLLQATAVLKCLYEVLLHADGEDAVAYAEVAHLAAALIDDSVGRLDRIRLRPMIDALAPNASHEHARGATEPGNNRVEEPRALYLS